MPNAATPARLDQPRAAGGGVRARRGREWRPNGHGSANANLALGTAAFALSFFAWSLIAPFAKGFKDDLGLNYTETMVLTAIPVLLGSLLRIPVGSMTDRLGGRAMFSVLLAVTSLPVLWFGYAGTYGELLLVGLLLGVAGTSFAIGVPFVSGWYPRSRQGVALGVFGVGNIGTSIAFATAPAIAGHWGREVLGIGTAAALLLMAAVVLAFASNAPGGATRPAYRDTLAAGMRLYRLALFYFVTFGGFVSMGLLLPTILQEWFRFSAPDAAARAAGFVVIATLLRPVGGWLADRLGGVRVLTLVFLAVIADAGVLALLSGHPQIVAVTVACLTMGAALGVGNGAVFKLVAEDFPEATGAAAGLVGAAGGIGGFLPVIFVGIVKDVADTYAYGFVAMQACVIACLLLLRQKPRPAA